MLVGFSQNFFAGRVFGNVVMHQEQDPLFRLSFTGDDEDGLSFNDDLWKYFHGEVDLNNKKYFFIDGKWYEVVGDFLKRLAEDFQEEIFGEKAILTSDIPFISWGSQGGYESAY